MEFTKIEVELVEATIERETDLAKTELSQTVLALVGGGNGTVIFY